MRTSSKESDRIASARGALEQHQERVRETAEEIKRLEGELAATNRRCRELAGLVADGDRSSAAELKHLYSGQRPDIESRLSAVREVAAALNEKLAGRKDAVLVAELDALRQQAHEAGARVLRLLGDTGPTDAFVAWLRSVEEAHEAHVKLEQTFYDATVPPGRRGVVQNRGRGFDLARVWTALQMRLHREAPKVVKRVPFVVDFKVEDFARSYAQVFGCNGDSSV